MAEVPAARSVSVVIPVYFNEGSLPGLFTALLDVEQALCERGLTLQLVFVDDGSGDGSHAELMRIKAARPATTVVKLTRNFGAVPAIRTGLRFVTGDAFAFLAADLQDPPGLVVEMVDRWRAGSKFVIAERETRGDPMVSRLLSRVYYWLLRKLVLPGYPAGGFDLALMDRVMLQPLRDSAKSAFLPLLAYWLGYRPDVLRYDRRPRVHGRSRWTLRKRFRAFVDVMLGFSVTPIRAISAVGAIVSLASFVYGAAVVFAAFVGHIPVPGFSTLVALVTFLLGLIILMLGVIGEYLWRIFDESNRRPEAVVDEVN
ncbi:MAG: glycosyltransferase family 2 protein [Betaproteobacteria bacterium]